MVVKETDPQKYWKVDLTSKGFHRYTVSELWLGGWVQRFSSNDLDECRTFAKWRSAALPEYY